MALAIIPITAVINFFYGRFLHHNQVKVQTALADANHVANEVVGAIRTVFSFATEPAEHARYKCRIDTYYALNVRQIFVTAIYFGVCNTFLINMVVQAALLGYGSFLAKSPSTMLDPKILLAVMLYQGQLGEYFRNLLTSFNSLIKSSGAAAKVFDYIDRRPRYSGGVARFALLPSSSPAAAPAVVGGLERRSVQSRNNNDAANNSSSGSGGGGGGRIVFERVHFCYPTRLDTEVLRGVSFSAAPGEIVALVGPSGMGKSTCFHLLEHFYEPQAGRVTLNGVSIAEMDHADLHRQVSLVSQEPTLLSGSIASNIMYGTGLPPQSSSASERGRGGGGVSYERMGEAATAANAHGFISALPDGYDTEVGERGVQLSGGQKQRIAIARCLVNNPSVLLLDEATSSLDTESEAVVQEALERAMANRTTLVIAHRLSTVKSADRIIVLDRGRVVESGTHQELMLLHEDGVRPPSGVISYRALVQRQQLQ